MSTKKKNTASQIDDPEIAYEAFVEGLEVLGIALSSSECRIERARYFNEKEETRRFTQEYEVVQLDERSFDARASFLVTVSTSDQNAGPALSIKCAFVAHIHGKAPIFEPHATRFANSELRLILVPFARQYIAAVSSQMSIPPIIVPLASRIGTKRTSHAVVKKKTKP